MPLFGKSQKTPAELVKALKEAVNSLERGDKKAEKAQEDVSKNLVSWWIGLWAQSMGGDCEEYVEEDEESGDNNICEYFLLI